MEQELVEVQQTSLLRRREGGKVSINIICVLLLDIENAEIYETESYETVLINKDSAEESTWTFDVNPIDWANKSYIFNLLTYCSYTSNILLTTNRGIIKKTGDIFESSIVYPFNRSMLTLIRGYFENIRIKTVVISNTHTDQEFIYPDSSKVFSIIVILGNEMQALKHCINGKNISTIQGDNNNNDNIYSALSTGIFDLPTLRKWMIPCPEHYIQLVRDSCKNIVVIKKE